MSSITHKDAETPAPPASRYDPSSVHRISDIHDLVDDGDDSSMEDTVDREFAIDDNGDKYNNTGIVAVGPSRGSRRYCKQSIVLISLFGIIIGATLAMGYAIRKNGSYSSHKSGPTYVVGGATVPEEEEYEAELAQDLLEMAERITLACSEEQLNVDMKQCDDLCWSSRCCFETGDYSCYDDESKNCAVYAGCEALM